MKILVPTGMQALPLFHFLLQVFASNRPVPFYNRYIMEKKTCKTCGKTWIIDRFDDHLCIALPKKTRKVRATVPPSADQTETVSEGSPLVSFRRMA